MSYCRWWPNTSDVYMFPAGVGDKDVIRCCGCWLAYDPENGEVFGASVDFDTPQEALDHLLAHRKAGHLVPEDAIQRLKNEAGL